MKVLKAHKGLIVAMVFFATIYVLISLVNHYNFRTYALDLGLYTNALWDYAHFQWNDSGVFKQIHENLLADHFDLYLIIFSPFSYIFGSYSLLILQIIFVLLGGAGVYRFFHLSEKTKKYALPAALFFYGFFGTMSALSFDYHSNTVAAALLPWFFYYIKQKRVLATSLIILGMLISKENVSLWMAFICLGMLIEYRKNRFWRRYFTISMVFSFLYFFIVISVLMPAISNASAYPHFNYSVLGNSPSEAVLYLLTHPLLSIKTFFTNHITDPDGDFVKLEFLILLLVSGLYILVRKPVYLIMLIPLFFQKFFHDNISMWGVSSHYSVEFAPVMAIGIFSSLATVHSKRLKSVLLVLVLAGCFASTIRIMDNTIAFTDKARIRIYQSHHYKRDYDVSRVHKALEQIPGDAVVSAQSPFLPHLALRDHIYQWPIVKDAEYIILSTLENAYPVNNNKIIKEIELLSGKKEWIMVYKEEGLFIFKRI